jgi:hypothetical protein
MHAGGKPAKGTPEGVCMDPEVAFIVAGTHNAGVFAQAPVGRARSFAAKAKPARADRVPDGCVVIGVDRMFEQGIA